MKSLYAVLFVLTFGMFSGNAQQVIIYSGCDLKGDKQVLREGQYRDRDIRIGNDRISSIRVPSGWAITVYKSNNFEGASETYYDNVRCLPDKFNDAISSFRVFRSGKMGAPVVIYSGCNLKGDSQNLREGQYRDRDIEIGNDRISSIRVPSGWVVTVYKSNNFEGASATYTRDIRCLPDKFNDAISSLKVRRSRR
jgi:hypothetical protein